MLLHAISNSFCCIVPLYANSKMFKSFCCLMYDLKDSQIFLLSRNFFCCLMHDLKDVPVILLFCALTCYLKFYQSFCCLVHDLGFTPSVQRTCCIKSWLKSYHSEYDRKLPEQSWNHDLQWLQGVHKSFVDQNHSWSWDTCFHCISGIAWHSRQLSPHFPLCGKQFRWDVHGDSWWKEPMDHYSHVTILQDIWNSSIKNNCNKN